MRRGIACMDVGLNRSGRRAVGAWPGIVALAMVAVAMGHAGVWAQPAGSVRPDYDLFVHTVRPFLAKHCATVDCHGGKEAGDLRVQRTGPRPSEKVLRADYEMLLGFVVPGEPMKSPLVLKPLRQADGGQKHKSDTKLTRSSRGIRLLSGWIEGRQRRKPAPPPKRATRSKAGAAKSGPAKAGGAKPAKRSGAAAGPVAVAGPDREAVVGDVVQLNGRGSRGKKLTYRWRLAFHPDGSRARLRGAETATPSLQPDRPGIYVINLQVFEGDRPSPAAKVRIYARPKEGATVVLEAENGELVAPMDVVEDATASQKKAVGIRPGDPVKGSASWTFAVSDAGLYRLFAAVKNPGASLTAFTVSIDGDKAVPWRVGKCATWEEQVARQGSLAADGSKPKHAWRVLKGTWRVHGGKYQVTGPGRDSSAALTRESVGEGTVDVEVQVTRGQDAGAYIVFDYQGEGRSRFAGLHVTGDMAQIGPDVNAGTQRRFAADLRRTYRLTLRLRKGPGTLYLAQLYVDGKLQAERLYPGAFVGRVGLMARGEAAFDKFRVTVGGKTVREDGFDQVGPEAAAASQEPIEWRLGEGKHGLTVTPLVKGVLIDRLMLRKAKR